jgi:hypothetical protein
MAPSREELEREEEALCGVLEAAEQLLQCAPRLRKRSRVSRCTRLLTRVHLFPGPS